MSDFKRKIEIVESTTPPPNKYNWWFDLNTNELKRFSDGEWSKHDAKPFIPVSMPGDNEIWLQLYYDENEYEIQQSEIEEFLTTINYSTADLERYEQRGNVLKLVFKTPISDLEETYISEGAISYDNPILAIKLPKLAYIGTEMEDNVVNISTIIMQEILDVEDYAFYCDTLICLAKIPPAIGRLESYDEDMDEGIRRVYVQDSVVDKYKVATNWSSFDIRGLSSLDKSVYNWG